MSDQGNMILLDSNDPKMYEASKSAQKEFKYFWREVSWERRRIVPALELACVKVAFRTDQPKGEAPELEHMWVGDIDFDGEVISGTLLNAPNWISGLNEADSVTANIADVGDWMFVIQGKVYGAFTVNLMRSRMSPEERQNHDAAWGFDFGDAFNILLEHKPVNKSAFGTSGAGETIESPEHPMSLNMGDSLAEQLKSSSELLTYLDEKGWSILHQEALAGNSTSVKVLLDHGADKTLKTQTGETPLDLAKKLNWDHVVAVLES
ncbi:YegJ family protein [Litoribacillus peritrichatus]|uniref:DUF2314 domain-containing protein n=1 Tax=Litoribacillus peritrichatus TaxID=718191 RepID=A0ABP7N324_9GAMM